MVAVIIIVVVVVLLALLLVGSYNGIVRMRNQVDNGWSQIDVQIKRRADYRSSPAPVTGLAEAAFIEAARRSTMRISEREHRFVAAVAAWVDGDLPRAIALHDEQAREHPRDLASLKLGQYHCFNRGDSPAMLRLALQAQHAAADVPVGGNHRGTQQVPSVAPDRDLSFGTRLQRQTDPQNPKTQAPMCC